MNTSHNERPEARHTLFREVFIGELGAGDALDWGGDPDVGNVPRRIGPVFPRTGAAIDPYDVVVDWLRKGRASGRRVDWGAVAIVVQRDDIWEFLTDSYGRYAVPNILIQAFASLDPKRKYALVASEA